MPQYRPIRRALLSVSDKTGIVDFANALAQRGIELLSTGGTAQLLRDAGLKVTEVSDYTQFPEIMGGRVKTLHPKVHGGILGRRDQDSETMQQHGIQPIDMVVVNLYPFSQTIAKSDCTLEDAIENIDIGGPAMIRAAAKNHHDVTVVVANSDFTAILAEMDAHQQQLTYQTRLNLAVKAYEHTAAYDGMIANYLGMLVPAYGQSDNSPAGRFPRTLTLQYIKKQTLRYGENAHQQAAFYVEPQPKEASIATAIQLQGKELSYNNITDSDAALACVKEFSEPACVIVKHANPCGVALGSNLLDAYQRAYQTDPTSAFGGIIAFNQPLDAQTTQAILNRQFVEVIIAPVIMPDALTILTSKPNIRVLECGSWQQPIPQLDVKQINGGLLVQDRDQQTITDSGLRMVSQRLPTEQELCDALFCWKVAKFVKSNAIVYAREQMTVGIGAGQMSRVYSAKIAALKASDENLVIEGAVMASDAFFPFRDSVDTAAAAGITCIIQPGGSIRDDEVIAAANEHNIAMVFTDMRHFRH